MIEQRGADIIRNQHGRSFRDIVQIEQPARQIERRPRIAPGIDGMKRIESTCGIRRRIVFSTPRISTTPPGARARTTTRRLIPASRIRDMAASTRVTQSRQA